MAEFNYFNYNAVTSLSLSMQKKRFFSSPSCSGWSAPKTSKYKIPEILIMVYSSIQTSSFLITAEQFYLFKKKSPVLMWDSIKLHYFSSFKSQKSSIGVYESVDNQFMKFNRGSLLWRAQR